MCGITGYIDLGRSQLEADLLAMVTASAANISHRGPDATGAWADEQVGIALGHRRLSIIDLSPTGAQPMQSHSERYITVYNGEIYNYQDLAAELSQRGVRFRGTSDTEVMLAAFDTWGVDHTLEKLTGMFAIAVWDRAEQSLWLARDRMGEKPLYYGYCGNQFAFASELKAFHALATPPTEISEAATELFLRKGYIPAPYSIYTNIAKLSAASYIQLSLTDLQTHVVPQPTQYWTLPTAANPAQYAGPDAVIAAFEERFSAVIKRQMISDVPLGAFLSGGIDSSLVVALMQAQSSKPVRTFTIGFVEESHNEAVYAKKVADHLGTQHTEYYLEHAEAQAVIPDLPEIYDEPFADSSQLPTYLVSRLARQDVTVCLSGDGGDELLGGYHRYQNVQTAWDRNKRNIFQQLNAPQRVAQRVAAHANSGLAAKLDKYTTAYTGLPAFNDIASFYPHYVYRNWIGNSVTQATANAYFDSMSRQADAVYAENIVQQFMAYDVLTYLPDDILVKLDRAGMANSLEARVPFLDHQLVEFIWQLPFEYKVRKGNAKWLAKELLGNYVPRALFERKKQGFGIPISGWLRNSSLVNWADDLLQTQSLREIPNLPTALIQQRWQQHRAGHADWAVLLWRVLMLQAWRQRWQR